MVNKFLFFVKYNLRVVGYISIPQYFASSSFYSSMINAHLDILPESLISSIFSYTDCVVPIDGTTQTFDKIVETINDLSAVERQIIRLRYMQELPVREIAHTLSLGESYVRSRLNQAMHKLRMAGNEKYRKMVNPHY